MTSSYALLGAALVGSPDPDLLDRAATFAVARRASPPVIPELPPFEAPPPADSGPFASERFASVVAMLLGRADAERQPLLREALTAATDAGLTVPTRLVVPLLEAGRAFGDATLLPRVLGQRGRWLASLNPAWTPVAPPVPQPQHWEEGTEFERVAWLRHLRATNPAAGRALVEGATKERAATREAFLTTLEVGLSPDDEPLLEKSLDDRAKGVCKVAASLLAQVPSSAYLARAAELARGRFTRRGLLRKTTVATAPPETPRDRHVEVEPSTLPGAPARLFALMALVPPGRWPEFSGVAVEHLLADVELDGDPINVAPALAQAALRFGDVAAARHVLQAGHGTPSLLRLLPPDEMPAAATRLAERLPWAEVSNLHDAFDGATLPAPATRALLTRLVGPTAPARLLAGQQVEDIARTADIAFAEEWLETIRRLPSDLYARSTARASQYLTLRHSIRDALAGPPKENS